MKISLRARQNRSYGEGEPPSIKIEEIATLLNMFALGFLKIIWNFLKKC